MEGTSPSRQLALSSLKGSAILQMLPFNKCQSSLAEPDCCHKLPLHVTELTLSTTRVSRVITIGQGDSKFVKALSRSTAHI